MWVTSSSSPRWANGVKTSRRWQQKTKEFTMLVSWLRLALGLSSAHITVTKSTCLWVQTVLQNTPTCQVPSRPERRGERREFSASVDESCFFFQSAHLPGLVTHNLKQFKHETRAGFSPSAPFLGIFLLFFFFLLSVRSVSPPVAEGRACLRLLRHSSLLSGPGSHRAAVLRRQGTCYVNLGGKAPTYLRKCPSQTISHPLLFYIPSSCLAELLLLPVSQCRKSFEFTTWWVSLLSEF